MMQSNSLTYVSNAGVLMKINDKKILIDGLCSSEIPIYKETPVKIREQIIGGIPPFDNIDLFLITHHHSDHFDAKMIGNFLEANPNTIVISNYEVISRIRSNISDVETTRLIELKPKLQCGEKIRVNGIDVLAIPMIHDGKEYENVDHLSFLIEYEVTVLHIGDAAPVKENYEPLNRQQYSIDLLIATFPYVGLPSARQIIKEYINPKKISLVHLPYKELDSFGWINATKKSYDRVKDHFIETEFLEEVGVTINI